MSVEEVQTEWTWEARPGSHPQPRRPCRKCVIARGASPGPTHSHRQPDLGGGHHLAEGGDPKVSRVILGMEGPHGGF